MHDLSLPYIKTTSFRNLNTIIIFRLSYPFLDQYDSVSRHMTWRTQVITQKYKNRHTVTSYRQETEIKKGIVKSGRWYLRNHRRWLFHVIMFSKILFSRHSVKWFLSYTFWYESWQWKNVVLKSLSSSGMWILISCQFVTDNDVSIYSDWLWYKT